MQLQIRFNHTFVSSLALLLLLLTPLTLAAQEQMISIKEGNITIREAFNQIEEQAGVSFAYNQTRFNDAQRVTVSRQVTKLHNVLTSVLSGTGYTYKVNGRYIIITKPIAAEAGAETQQIEGVIVDERTSMPLAYAYVALLSDPTKNVLTNKMGYFSLPNAPLGTQTLEIKCENYEYAYRGVLVTAAKAPNVEIKLVAQAERVTNAPTSTPAPKQAAKTTEIEEPLAPQTHTDLSTKPALAKPTPRYHARYAQKMNLLYLATTTPNLALEFALANKWSLEVGAGYNPWEFNKRTTLRHWLVQPELRYWPCQVFEGHFFGIHGLYSKFNVGELSFINALKDYTYKGDLYGGGISYGYHHAMTKRWALEFTLGVGYVHLNYDKYSCKDCLELQGSYKRNYFGPTKAGISLIYMVQ